MSDQTNLLEIEGTFFYFDQSSDALVEVNDRTNKIYLSTMRDHGNYYSFEYSCRYKNLHSITGISELKGILNRLIESSREKDPPRNIRIPKNYLTPEQNLTKDMCATNDLLIKADTEIMNDKDRKTDRSKADLELRLKGQLPTIDILGHTFYVDLRMGKLRPKDDFLSNGIIFSDIEDYFSEEKGCFIIPYDPKKKEFVPLDYETITEIPKDLKVISFKDEYALDPVGWTRREGFPMDMKKIRLHFKAKNARWEDIYVPQKIKENLRNNFSDQYTDRDEDMPQKKGRKI